MAQGKDNPDIDWVKPAMRAQLPIKGFHIPRRLKTFLNTHDFKITVDQDFNGVIDACAELTNERRETWINQEIIEIFCAAHADGHAHSVEIWDENNALIGGIYGLSIGAVFFAESMFSRVSNASKVALVHLHHILDCGGYEILDVQFTNPHLEQFGVFETPHDAYDILLQSAVKKIAIFNG